MKAFHCVAIVGVGLIGGSVGLAVRDRRLAKTVVGVGSRPHGTYARTAMPNVRDSA